MVSCEIITRSPEQTQQAGVILAKHLVPGDCLPLTGNIGSGKTCFVQGIAKGLGVPEDCPVTSPSFTLVNRYPGRYAVFHVDLYRLNAKSDLEELELDEILQEDGIVLIEWPELTIDNLPEALLYVQLYWDMDSEFERRIRFSGSDPRFLDFFKEIHRAFSGN
jgi:tRNA threonylcarbamoyladenosine biosynthesis protein TsaE